MTSMPKSKIDLLVRFFAVCCFRSYLYVSLNKFTTVVYNPDLTEELNEDWNSVCLKIVVVWNTYFLYIQVSAACFCSEKIRCIIPFVYLTFHSAFCHAVMLCTVWNSPVQCRNIKQSHSAVQAKKSCEFFIADVNPLTSWPLFTVELHRIWCVLPSSSCQLRELTLQAKRWDKRNGIQAGCTLYSTGPHCVCHWLKFPNFIQMCKGIKRYQAFEQEQYKGLVTRNFWISLWLLSPGFCDLAFKS